MTRANPRSTRATGPTYRALAQSSSSVLHLGSYLTIVDDVTMASWLHASRRASDRIRRPYPAIAHAAMIANEISQLP